MSKSVEVGADGAEYGVEAGTGTISKVDWPAEGKRNAQVEITAEGLRFPLKGWADTEDAAIREVLTEPRPPLVTYRIEIHRDRDHDKTIPIADVDKFKKFRRLVLCAPAAAGGPDGAPPPSRHGNDKFAGLPHDTETSPDPSAGQPVDNAPSTGPSVQMKSGGDLTDTWGYCATIGCVELAFEHLVAARYAGTIEAVTPTLVRWLGQLLLSAANDSQALARGAVDLNANSHTRARGAVRSALVNCPPPLASNFEDPAWDEWVTKLTKTAGSLMTIARTMLEDHR